MAMEKTAVSGSAKVEANGAGAAPPEDPPQKPAPETGALPETTDYKALYEQGEDAKKQLAQRLSSAEGRLRQVDGQRTETRRISRTVGLMLDHLTDPEADPAALRKRAGELDSEEAQEATQGQLATRANLMKRRIDRNAERVGIDTDTDPRLADARRLWAEGVSDPARVDIQRVEEAYDMVDELIATVSTERETQIKADTRKAVEDDVKRRSEADGELDLDGGGGSGAAESKQELLNRFARGENMPMEDKIRARDAINEGVLPKRP